MTVEHSLQRLRAWHLLHATRYWQKARDATYVAQARIYSRRAQFHELCASQIKEKNDV